MTVCLISIITVCRNDLSRLKKTINSLKEIYDDDKFEHLVIDGNSTDDTRDYVDSLYKINNFRFYSQVDKGIYDAMNIGINYSSGKYLIFLNCGDLFSAKSSDLVEFISAKPSDTQPEIICFPFRETSDSVSRLILPKLKVIHKLPTSHQAMIYSRSFIALHHYNTNYKIAADFDLYLKANANMVSSASVGWALSTVEAIGVASENSFQSYFDYFQIIVANQSGVARIFSVILILLRGSIVITLKNLLPKNIYIYIRKKLL